MHISFRTDASVQIGTGHVMRCLTLADALRERGAQCTFVCRPHTGHLLDAIAQRGHTAHALPRVGLVGNANVADPTHAAWLGTDWQSDAKDMIEVMGAEHTDWLVVDHYALDRRWEQALRPHCQRLMVIDDLADRPHDCDLILDQNLGRTIADYDHLLGPCSEAFMGPQYALLRPEFSQFRSRSLSRRKAPQLKQLLITMGGVDKDNATGHVLDVLRICSLLPELTITVVMGPNAPWLKQVKENAASMPWPTQVLVGVSNMAELMAECDLAIGAAGGTAWERCSLGVPSLILVLAENQQEGANALQQAGAAIPLQSPVQIMQWMQSLSTPEAISTRLQSMAQAAARVTDGTGTDKIVERMISAHA